MVASDTRLWAMPVSMASTFQRERPAPPCLAGSEGMHDTTSFLPGTLSLRVLAGTDFSAS
jgi:hypothetical protein